MRMCVPYMRIVRAMLASPVLLGAFAIGVWADVIYVPGDHPTISAAATAAIDGDEIVVAPGSYLAEDVDLRGKFVTLRSSGGHNVTSVIGPVRYGGRGGVYEGFRGGLRMTGELAGTVTAGSISGGLELAGDLTGSVTAGTINGVLSNGAGPHTGSITMNGAGPHGGGLGERAACY